MNTKINTYWSKKIILTSLFVIFLNTIQSQNFRYGVKTGSSTYSTLDDGEIEDDESRATIGFGLYGEYKISEKVYLQSEISYSRLKNSKENVSQGEFDANSSTEIINKSKASVDFLNVPVLVKYNIGKKLYASMGPQISFLLDSKNKETTIIHEKNRETGTIINSTTLSEETKLNKYLTKVDFGINVGVGYSFTDSFFGEIRYYNGLINASKIPGENLKFKKIEFSIGYKF